MISESHIQPRDNIGQAHASPWRGALVVTALSLLGFGFCYGLVGIGLGQLLFPAAANGSLRSVDGRVVGSALVGQPFVSEGYFQPRPSVANFDPMAAAGSNQARSNPALQSRLAEATAAVMARDGRADTAVPPELITQSGSGLDPDITPAGAHAQANRVAKARLIAVDRIHALIDEQVVARTLGVLGEPRVNVLELNIALDVRHPLP